MRNRCIFTLAVFMMLAILGDNFVLAADVSVEATLSRHTFAVDEGARLAIVVSGMGRNAGIELPEIENIKLHPRGQSSQITLVNWEKTSSVTYNYIVQALQPGKYTLPPITVRVEGGTLSTKSIPFEVTGVGVQHTSIQNGAKTVNDIAFITMSETGDHFPGEIVPITLKAYFNQNYRIDLNTLPTLSADGVVMPQLDNDPERKQEIVDGVLFHVLTWQTSLAGIKTGSHLIKFSLDASLLIAPKRQSTSPFGGGMFDNFFGNVQRKAIVVKSPGIVFNVLPLPEKGRPESFTGAIGRFSLSVRGLPLKVEVGEPITLTMVVTGEGNFNRVEAPVFPKTRSWKTYSPTSYFSRNSERATGQKTFEQAIVVKQSGVVAIPSVSFSYFDPSVKKYVTLQSDPIPLEVQGLEAGGEEGRGIALSNSRAPGGYSAATASPLPLKMLSRQVQSSINLAPIRLEIGTLHGSLVPLFQQAWFVFISAVCFLCIAVLLWLHWRRQKGDGCGERSLVKKKQGQLEKDLMEVERAQNQADGTLFLQWCRTAIQNYVGASRLETAAAISLTDLKNQLADLSPLVVIFARAEEAAYGGATLSSEEMASYFLELKTELEKLK